MCCHRATRVCTSVCLSVCKAVHAPLGCGACGVTGGTDSYSPSTLIRTLGIGFIVRSVQ